jgi:hypothetical protein
MLWTRLIVPVCPAAEDVRTSVRTSGAVELLSQISILTSSYIVIGQLLQTAWNGWAQLYTWFQTFAVMLMRSAIFRDLTQRRMVFPYRPFGTSYSPIFKGKQFQKNRTYDVCKSVHHHTIQVIQPTRRNSFTSLLLDVYVWLNMFRASSRPSSGAYNCTKSPWFYLYKICGQLCKLFTCFIDILTTCNRITVLSQF